LIKTGGGQEGQEGGLAGRLSRRSFLQLAASLGLAGAVPAVTGCSPPAPAAPPTSAAWPLPTGEPTSPPTVTLAPTFTPTALPSETASAVPTVTASPSPTATPICVGNLFDEAALARVYVAQDPQVQGYPAVPPFDPGVAYPEYLYPGDELGIENGCYHLVREALRLFSPAGYGTPGWNPLGSVIRPGDTVLIKPNLVDDSAWQRGQITHPAFLRPIVDLAAKACGPNGRVVLGEGPWAAGVFDRVVRNTGIQAMVEHLAEVHGVPVSLRDLNKASRETTPLVDLGDRSALSLASRTWLDAHYKPMTPAGDPGVGRYWIAPEVLRADVVISVPKLKVHCSGGITVTMKNMLGLIPAWDGPYEKAQLKDCAHASDVDLAQGNRGKYLDNDTIWRSMADLNRILLYADQAGALQPSRQRRYLTIVDGIVAAEESQYKPHPRPLGTVIVGMDPVSCDAVSARVMGFDPRKLRSVTQPEQVSSHPLGPWRAGEVQVLTSWGSGLNAVYRSALAPELRVFSWQGQVEASDFDPPEVQSVTWDADRQELRVQVRDQAGADYVRVRYDHEGQRFIQALALAAGDARAGEWRLFFPAGAAIHRGELWAGDLLFNEERLAVAW
jgi:uncharacterized protein (DUF362 family)